MSIDGLLQVKRWILNPLVAKDGTKGIMLEFQIKQEVGKSAPVRIAMTEAQAADLVQMLSRALSLPRLGPEKPTSKH